MLRRLNLFKHARLNLLYKGICFAKLPTRLTRILRVNHSSLSRSHNAHQTLTVRDPLDPSTNCWRSLGPSVRGACSELGSGAFTCDRDTFDSSATCWRFIGLSVGGGCLLFASGSILLELRCARNFVTVREKKCEAGATDRLESDASA
mmetsp:Transcript_44751/g.71527  ORF Transcript_44751/g.71527 Transcript_44751/m.71527 type:complete len:148 (-) Transcript_44751:77-520(-)